MTEAVLSPEARIRQTILAKQLEKQEVFVLLTALAYAKAVLENSDANSKGRLLDEMLKEARHYFDVLDHLKKERGFQ